ncbi:MAG TPA: carbohydrate ABC transporter permease [Chloroflexia bacterium]|nr:carbohydrate ABC transporter permease [Chloroflexia bacterium]
MATKVTTSRAGVVPAPETKAVGREPSYYVLMTIRYAVLLLMTVIFLGPFIMALLGSFKTNLEVLTWPPTFFPTEWRLDNYASVWNVLPDPAGNSYFPRWILNSFILSASIVIAQLFFCSLAGFAFARLNFPGKGIVFAAMLSTMMIPGMVLMIPKYQILNAVGLVNTYWALIIPGMVSAGMIFMLTQFFRSIPKDLDEAAWIDGAGIFTTYWRIILPLAKPALATLALLTFQGVWNTYLDALVLLQTPDMYPLTVGLGFLKGQYATSYNIVLAGSMFNTVPMVLLFMIFSRFYVQGATYSGVKG